MTFEGEVGLAGRSGIGEGWVFGAVEEEDVTRGGLGGDDVRVLRHVPRPIDFAGVRDLLHDVHARSRRAIITANFCLHSVTLIKQGVGEGRRRRTTFVIIEFGVVEGIWLDGDLNLGNDECVLLGPTRMSTHEQPLDRHLVPPTTIVSAYISCKWPKKGERPFYVWEPLAGEGGPDGGMLDDDVVEVRRLAG